ncbi:MAG: hypothetical protein JWO51_190 [Rhodospirillales bacterium]|nr:hypothetical protein [Rhodospirillales bacterium]
MGIDQTIARIRSYAVFRGWRKSRLAAEAKMSDTTLRDFDEPDWNPTAETIRRLEAIIPADFIVGSEVSERAA